jgi:hypothetical protein
MFDALLDALESELRAAPNTAVTGLVATARTRIEEAVAEVAEKCAKGLAEIAQEKADLHRKIEAMQTHQVQQEGCVELNIGGYRFQTSVQTLRRVPHTFFDAYFSGGTRRMSAMTAASLLTVTASTLGMSSNTCATAWYRWRSLARIRA